MAAGGRLLLLGVSTRALAESARRSRRVRVRFASILSLDYFGDTDLDAPEPRSGRPARPAPDGAIPVRTISIARDLLEPRRLDALGRAALARRWDAVACAGGIENRPGLLRLLSRRGRLLGPDPDAVRAVRDPRRLCGALDDGGFARPAFSFGRRRPAGGGRWLLKRLRGGGGGGVRAALRGERRRKGEYFQERVPGSVCSAAFLADGREAVVLGVTRGIAGWRALGADGFRYSGSIAGPWDRIVAERALARMTEALSFLAARFALRGLGGADFVVRGSEPHLIEVNPRWTASMELLEETSGLSFFDLMLGVDEGRRARDLVPAPPGLRASAAVADPAAFVAKGILYARRACAAPDPETLRTLGCRDRPRRGERFARRAPVTTIVVRAAGAAGCRSRLRAVAARVEALLGPPPHRAAGAPGRLRAAPPESAPRTDASRFRAPPEAW